MAVNGTEIAVGQKWLTRGGDEVEIVGYDDETNTEYVWDLSPEGSVTDEGYCLSVHSPSDYDLTTLIQDEHGFIPWNGGECPVGDYIRVEYKMRGYDDTDIAIACSLYWEHKDTEADIIAYRVVKQEAEPAKVEAEEEHPKEQKEIDVEDKIEAKEEPKYTVEQVFKAINEATDDLVMYTNVGKVKAHLNAQDPDYKLYLYLKAKFE